jgi:hypothetical protein
LVMDDRARVGEKFRFGVRLEHASVVLHWGDYSDFKDLQPRDEFRAASLIDKSPLAKMSQSTTETLSPGRTMPSARTAP